VLTGRQSGRAGFEVDPATSLPTFYGLGWVVFQDEHGRRFWRHNGAFSSGARTAVVLLPRHQLGMAVVTNAFPSGIPEGMTRSFFDLVLNGRVQKDWVAWANDDFDQAIKLLLGQQTNYSKPPAKPTPRRVILLVRLPRAVARLRGSEAANSRQPPDAGLASEAPTAAARRPPAGGTAATGRRTPAPHRPGPGTGR